MFGLTSLGVVHTLLSLIALVAGFWSLVQYKRIAPQTRLGQVYIWSTVLVCLTGFGIFQHGGFGKPHMLGIITLVVLAVAALAGKPRPFLSFGSAAPYVETICYSLTLFLHIIPATTEGLTRLPAGAPVFANAEAPQLPGIYGVFFLIFLVGTALQVRALRRGGAGVSP